MTQPTADVRRGYDAVAAEYVRRIADELKDKPLDRRLLDQFAGQVRGLGTVCDMGCGPGHIARYLHDRGVHVCGVDLSLEMLLRARRLNPPINFIQADLLNLPIADGAFAAVAAFYSICNFPPEDLPHAFAELHRVLRPRGLLLLSFHIGDEVKHLDEWWGHSVSIDFYSFNPAHVRITAEAAGFTTVDVVERDPYPQVEHQSRRAYILCRASLSVPTRN